VAIFRTEAWRHLAIVPDRCEQVRSWCLKVYSVERDNLGEKRVLILIAAQQLRIRSCPTPGDQFGAHQLRERVIDLLLQYRRNGTDPRM
jgi:hypothetical protein